MPKGIINDLTGFRFGALTVLTFDVSSRGKGRRYYCKCDCGTLKSILGTNLMAGNTVSCGCMRGKASKHGDCKDGSETNIYRLWGHMKERCTNPKKDNYDRYGGRGIKVCDEWMNNFELFKAWALDHGYKRGLQIDRIDSNGNYEPGNCRFVTGKINTRNQAQVRLNPEKVLRIRELLSEGKMTMREIGKMFGVTHSTISDIRNGKRWDDVK